VQAKMVHSKAILYTNDANCSYRLLISKSSDSGSEVGSSAELKTVIWTGP
jgi:hypothetical protein